MKTKRITITLPADLVRTVDKAAKKLYCLRSDFIRESVVMRLNNQKVVTTPQEVDKEASLDEYLAQFNSTGESGV